MIVWLSTKSVAHRLDLSPETAAKMIRRGDFGPRGQAWTMLGREYRLLADALDAWQAERMGQVSASRRQIAEEVRRAQELIRAAKTPKQRPRRAHSKSVLCVNSSGPLRLVTHREPESA